MACRRNRPWWAWEFWYVFPPLQRLITEHAKMRSLAEQFQAKPPFYNSYPWFWDRFAIFSTCGHPSDCHRHRDGYAHLIIGSGLWKRQSYFHHLRSPFTHYRVSWSGFLWFQPKNDSRSNFKDFLHAAGTTFHALWSYSSGEVTLFGITTDVSLWFVVLLGLGEFHWFWAGLACWRWNWIGEIHQTGARRSSIMGLCGHAIMPWSTGNWLIIWMSALPIGYFSLVISTSYLCVSGISSENGTLSVMKSRHDTKTIRLFSKRDFSRINP